MNTVRLFGLSGIQLYGLLAPRGLMKLSRGGSAVTSLVSGQHCVT